MTKSYEKKCPVCGEMFITRYSTKKFCCSECFDECQEVKKYLSNRLKKLLPITINEAKTTLKTEKQLIKEFMKKW